MILADKIILQRKKLGWSQEELAEQMSVSRQAVSKWEGAQSVPDLEKILRLSQIFGVSTDYLLKDEVEEIEYIETEDEMPPVKRVSMEEANTFLEIKAYTARRIALATFICILSPIVLLLLGVAGEQGIFGLTENMAGALGLLVMLIMVVPAVIIFISCGSKTSPFQYLETQVFETEYGVVGMVKERQNQFRNAYTKSNIIGTCLCILSVLPLIFCAFITENELVLCAMVCLLLLIAGVGVVFFIVGGINWASLQKLLQEGDYEKKRKKNAAFREALSTAYWLVVTAIFLAYSFMTNNWDRSWIIWPVAGVLYGAFAAVAGIVGKKN